LRNISFYVRRRRLRACGDAIGLVNQVPGLPSVSFEGRVKSVVGVLSAWREQPLLINLLLLELLLLLFIKHHLLSILVVLNQGSVRRRVKTAFRALPVVLLLKRNKRGHCMVLHRWHRGNRHGCHCRLKRILERRLGLLEQNFLLGLGVGDALCVMRRGPI